MNININPSANQHLPKIIKQAINNNLDIQICMCSDLNFMNPTLISINSLLTNTKYPHNLININLVITKDTLSKWNHTINDKIRKKYPNVKFTLREFISPEPLKIILQAYRNNPEIKKLTCYHTITNDLNYARFYLPCIFPKLDRVIYLDGDTLITGRIEELYWGISLTPKLWFGAIDAHKLGTNYFNYLHPKLGGYIRQIYPEKELIFNAGVYITSFKQWKKNDTTVKLEKWCIFNIQVAENLIYYSGTEAPLNLVFNPNNRIRISCRWNMVTKWKKRYPIQVKDACIIHFKGPRKPWLKNNQEKEIFCRLWDKYSVGVI